ncbi:MAG TPA: hypothetical protein VIL55_04160 [Naasia sp.]|jgi:hypothetical protein
MGLTEVVRKLDAYSIHGHLNPGGQDEELVDYEEFFAEVASRAVGVSFRVGSNLVALVESGSRQGRHGLRLASGDPAGQAEVFDPATGTAAEVSLGREQLLVSPAWVIVDPIARIAVVEKRRPGVPVMEIERFLSIYGRERLGMPGLTLSLNPVPSPSFRREIETFTRIREAAVVLRRPNHSFTSDAREMLGQIAEASNAQDVEVQVNAARGGTLSKDSGIVADILSFVKSAINPLLNARVVGNRPDFEGERSVSLNKHTVRGSARIETNSPADEQLNALDEAAQGLIEQAQDAGDE